MIGTGLTNRLRQRSRCAGLAVGLSMALTLGLFLGSFIVLYVRLEPFTRDFVGADVGADVGAPAAPTSRFARITLRALECPATTGSPGRCDGQPLTGVAFLVAGASRTTDDVGEASWAPGAGDHQIVTQRTSHAASYVSCADQVDGDILFDGIAPDPTRVDITTTASQPVVCDWYVHPQPADT